MDLSGTCRLCLQNQGEALETGNPLLVLSVHRRDGVLYMPGNTTLTSLNLAGQVQKCSHPNIFINIYREGSFTLVI